MRCTCGNPGTLLLLRRAFPYCDECFRHTIVKLFRHEVGDGPLVLRPARTGTGHDDIAADTYYREAVQALAQEARREIIESHDGATPGCAERAAAAAMRFLTGEDAVRERVIPSSITREELERFFKAAPQETDGPIERDLRGLEERYPGTLASILRSADDRQG